MKRYLALIIAAQMLLWAFPLRAQQEISVLTQNQYLGADLNPIITAATPEEFGAQVFIALEQIAANNFPVRAKLLARQIADRRPHVVALQEVYRFECVPNNFVGEIFCDDPTIAGAFNDHLPQTLGALGELGESYVEGPGVQNLSVEIPFDVAGDDQPEFVIKVTDRDVILVRSDVAPTMTVVPYSSFCVRPAANSGSGCNFQVFVSVDTPFGSTINVERGWVGVDVTVDGKDYRIVNTHLEVRFPDPENTLSAAVQMYQAGELIGILGATPSPGRSLIVAGDLNSSPVDEVLEGVIVPPYMQFVAGGFLDAWELRPGSTPEFTCCQAADLSNALSALYERIDMIFVQDVPDKVKKVRVFGEGIEDKESPFGLWPSDHGQVSATLQFY